ncbi:hypothetical protein EDD21DRAFT_366179 [Dissophora ornata]|nr:hypothetical protein EDD21DRAFT_366179 [Dissophora ornata]
MKRSRLPIRKRSVALLLLFSSLNIDAVVIPPSRWGHVSVSRGYYSFPLPLTDSSAVLIHTPPIFLFFCFSSDKEAIFFFDN